MKNIKRKLLVIAAVLAALLSLTACGPDNYIASPMPLISDAETNVQPDCCAI